MEERLEAQLIRCIFELNKFKHTFPPDTEMSNGEMMILHILSDNQSDDSGVAISQIALRHMSKSGLSQLLSGMEKKGYISRDIDREDRRKIKVILLPDGYEAIDHAHKFMDGFMLKLIDKMGAEETRDLINMLRRLLSAYNEVAEESGIRRKS